jgi:enoyl-CoA hydratase/long-chain 3-hydroxyacyl-CoA dehydrogenase
MLRIVRSQRLRFCANARFGIRSQSNAGGAVAAREYEFFENLEVRDGVAIVRLNGPGKMNTISQGLQKESDKIFRDKILNSDEIKAVVFISSKPDNFIAGADIDMIKAFENKADLKEECMKGHAFFNEVKKAGKPFVAAINGACLGGGLEWAMYCDYRIATTSKKTVLGLPEVKLGLMPGMAGTYHLPKLIGYKDSLDIILTGKNVRPDKAKKLGLVDMVCDPASLEYAAVEQAKALAAGSLKPRQRKRDWLGWFLEVTPWGRKKMYDMAKKQVDKTGGFYPSPYRILEVLETNMDKSKEQHLEAEAQIFSELAATPVSEALIGLFHGTTAVKKHDFGKPKHAIETVAVLGAGLMGAGIAQVSLDNGGYRVLLKDKFAAGVDKGTKNIHAALKAKVKKRRMTDYEFAAKTSKLVGLHDDSPSADRHLSRADVVIEAVFEELSVKHAVVKELERVVPAHCVIATNTSAIPITEIAKGAKNPERVIGMHYFSPVPMMPLLEIIQHAGTAPEVAAAAMELGSRQGKTPIFVKDVAGFYVNRCLGPFMSEVTALVTSGVDLLLLDDAMKKYGMPVGPVTLGDEVGVDISNHVGKFMAGADLGVRMRGGNPELMQKMVDANLLGRKAGKGFYLYPKDAKKGAARQINPEIVEMLKTVVTSPEELSMEDIQMRIITRFVNEASFCLQDQIIRSPVDGDIGAVFGIGFPPFLGGPFRMLDSFEGGTTAFVDQMQRYADKYGPQFEPSQLLKDYAKSGKKFHP